MTTVCVGECLPSDSTCSSCQLIHVHFSYGFACVECQQLVCKRNVVCYAAMAPLPCMCFYDVIRDICDLGIGTPAWTLALPFQPTPEA